MTRRILFSFLSLTVFVLAVLEVPLGVTFARKDYQQLLVRVERDAGVLAQRSQEVLQSTVITAKAQATLQQVVRDYETQFGGRVVVVDTTGKSVADSELPEFASRDFASRPEIQTALDGKVATGSRGSITLQTDLVFVAVPVASSSTVYGAVRITFPTGALNHRKLRYWLTLGTVAVVSLLITTAVAIIIARSVTRPIARLKTAAVAVGEGDLAARAPTSSGPPEVKELAAAFNETAGRLQELVTAQEAFVADASHQLRTPLTALRLRLENLESDVPPVAQDDLDGALQEVARLSRLVDGLLALARADRPVPGSPSGPTALLNALTEREAAWSALAAERSVQISVIGPDALSHISPDHVGQILDNLIANAIEVLAPGQRIVLRIEPLPPSLVRIHVTDEGPGMSAAERSRAFDRFWRAGTSAGELGGSGLGLAIVRKLARVSGGDAWLQEAPGGGIDAVVQLPMMPSGRSAPR